MPTNPPGANAFDPIADQETDRLFFRLIPALMLLLAALAAWGGTSYLKQRHQAVERAKLGESCRNLARQLENVILHDEALGAVSAVGLTHENFRQVLISRTYPAPPEVKAELNGLAQHYGISVAYLMDLDGRVVASSDYSGINLIGNNYGFRPYFKVPLTGRRFVYPALGVTTKEPGLYYSAPVYGPRNHRPAPVVGVLVFKIGIDRVQECLDAHPDPALLLTPGGVTFATNIPEWQFNLISPDAASHLDQRQFELNGQKSPPLLPVDLRTSSSTWQGLPYLVDFCPLLLGAELGAWKAVELHRVRTGLPTGEIAAVVGVALCIFGLGGALWLTRRRHRQLERQRQRREHEAQAAFLAQLRAAKDQAELINNLVPSAIFTVDLDKRITSWNRMAEKITGYSSAEALGQECALFTEHPCREVCGLYSPTVDKPIVGRECSIRIKSGEVRLIRKNAACLVDDSGRIVGGIESFEDITSQNAAEKALAESERRFRELSELLPALVVEMNLEGRVTYANQYAFAHTGYTPEDIERGFMAASLVSSADRPRALQGLAQALSTRSTIQNEYQACRRNGERFDVITCSAPILRDGQVAGVRSVLFDITERKQTEKALIQSDRLAAVGVLAAGIAHQFNNINTSVLGYAQLLLDDPRLPEMLRERLERIYNAAGRARQITQNLLTFAGKQKTTRQTGQLELVTAEVVDLLQEEFATQGIEIAMAPAQLPPAHLDQAEIGQVVLNLLINASHALLGRPEKRIELTFGSDPSSVWLDVRDSGCGIAPEQLKDIFLPFFSTKGEHSTGGSAQSAVRGTGLGLSLSQTIVDQHGGRLSVESVVGSGTTFRLSLPRQIERTEPQPEAPAQSGAPAAGKSETGRTILVLDDELDIVDLLRVVLEQRGYEVLATRTPRQARDWLCEMRVVLAFIDLQMPTVDGANFLRQLRAEGIKVARTVVMTGRLPLPVDELAGLEVTEILAKPFTAEEIDALLARQLS